ncbi:hypothetical protein TNCV_3086041 [Trichonephila clavipes]|nr:hypothetical protein TNCV_3086041 [Trichonephila clavipes]
MFGPSNSPEMNLVEYLWFHQENRICDATLPPRNVWEYYDQLKTVSTSTSDNSSTPYRVNALPVVDGFERKRKSGKTKLCLQEALDILQNLLFEISDVLTDDF